MNEENEKVEHAKPLVKMLMAKKDFKFQYGKDVYEIKKGKEVKVPKMFHANLKTEKVI